MPERDTNEIFFRLNRPQYSPIPEGVQAAMAWSLDPEREEEEWIIDTEDRKRKRVGYIFKKTSLARKKLGTIQVRQTMNNPGGASELKSKLEDDDFEFPGIDSQVLYDSLDNSLKGVVPPRAVGLSAVPLCQGAAFLQDPVGIHGVKNPPNYGAIVRQLYGLGLRPDDPRGKDPIQLWYEALGSRSSNLQSILKVATELKWKSVIKELPSASGTASLNRPPRWLANADTPFLWFKNAWENFCADEWRQSLPERRWSEWASGLLRTGIGLGFLWEARFYKRLAQAIVDETMVDEILDSKEPLLSWEDNTKPVSNLDQNPFIMETVADGLKAMTEIDGLLHDKKNEITDEKVERWQQEDNLQPWVSWAREKLGPDLKRLEKCFGTKPTKKAENNTLETIRYSLECRQEVGNDIDYLALIKRKSRRFLVVEPGPEWIVLLASLTAGKPGKVTTLDWLRKDLAKLGLKPSREILIAELERAGLTKGSHDAEDAIEVSGFLGDHGERNAPPQAGASRGETTTQKNKNKKDDGDESNEGAGSGGDPAQNIGVSDQRLIRKISETPADTWFEIAGWAKKNNHLKNWQRKLAFAIGRYNKNSWPLSIKQARQGERILSEVEKLGFKRNW